MIRIVKKFLKSSILVKRIVSFLIYSYLRFVYFTTRWKCVFPDELTKQEWARCDRTVVIAWHDRLAILPYAILHLKKRMHILVSPHSDGSIISSILMLFGFNIIYGSTNKNSVMAVKNIIRVLKERKIVAITPDGPRGPRREINSNIFNIARKCDAQMVCISCVATNFFHLRSWDKLMFPLPFGKITVHVGHFINSKTHLHFVSEQLKNELDKLTIGKI